MRYELKLGKYGMYFYDNVLNIDLTLNMILDKLNYSDKLLNDRLLKINKLNTIKNDLLKRLIISESKINL